VHHVTKQTDPAVMASSSGRPHLQRHFVASLSNQEYLVRHCHMIRKSITQNMPLSSLYSNRALRKEELASVEVSLRRGPVHEDSMCSLLSGNTYAPPSYRTVHKILELICTMMREEMSSAISDAHEYFQSRPFLHISSDFWTCPHSTRSYGTVEVHFAMNGAKQHYHLALRQLSGSHTSVAITEWLRKVLNDCSIPIEWVRSAVADGAYNIQGAMRLADIPVRHCVAHNFHLAVLAAAGLSNNRSLNQWMKGMVRKVRAIVGHFNRSPKATAALLKLQSDAPGGARALKTDVVTRWSALFQSWSRFLALRSYVLTYFLEHNAARDELGDAADALDSERLDHMRQVVAVLSRCNEFTTWVQDRNNYNTWSQWPYFISRLLQHLKEPATVSWDNTHVAIELGEDETDSRHSRKFRDLLTRQINKRFNLHRADNEQVVVSLLDPEVKGKCKDFFTPAQIETAWQTIDTEVRMLCAEEPPAAHDESSDSDEPPRKRKCPGFGQVSAGESDEEEGVMHSQTNTYRQAKWKYPASALTYWQKATGKALTSIAMSRLGGCATSADAESTFSIAGVVLSARRSSMLPEHFQQLVYCASNKVNLPSSMAVAKRYLKENPSSTFSIARAGASGEDSEHTRTRVPMELLEDGCDMLPDEVLCSQHYDNLYELSGESDVED